MYWENLLHSIRKLLAERDSSELEKRVRDLLNNHVTDDCIYSHGQPLDDWQLNQAKILVSNFLRDHLDLPEIIKKLELLFLSVCPKTTCVSAHKVFNREQLLQLIDVLVNSEKIIATEEVLVRGLQLEQVNPDFKVDDDVVTDADLDYIANDESIFSGLEASQNWWSDVVEPSKLQLNESHCNRTTNGLGLNKKNENVVFDVVSGQPRSIEFATFDAGFENYYSECEIQMVSGLRNESMTLFEDSQYGLQDCPALEDDILFDDETLIEQEDLDFYLSELSIFNDIDDEYVAYAFDPDDVYDSLNGFSSDAKLSEGRISREDRALQKAIELISNVDWSLLNLPLVQQIFVKNGWGATWLALKREIDKGMTPEELVLAAHVKFLWAENDYYWISYDKSGSSNLSQYVMSWPTALLLVRTFESLPQLEELERFIEILFEYWDDRPSLRRVFRSFNRFLWYRVSNLQGCLPANQPFNFCNPYELPVEEYSDLGLCYPLDIDRTAKLRNFGVF